MHITFSKRYSSLKGSGPHGRVVKRDVESAAETGAGRASPALSSRTGQAVARLAQGGGLPALGAMREDQSLKAYAKAA